MPEDFLRELGVHRIPVGLSFLEAGGPVNVYVFEREDGGLALFDAGFGTRVAEETLRAGFLERGVEVARIRDIYVSHGHVDHYGLAQTLSEESGATVHVHAHDFGKVVGPSRVDELLPRYEAYFRRLGVPEGDLRVSLSLLRQAEKFARRVEPSRARVLEPGTRLRFQKLSVEVLHMPGHTPGLVCLWDAEHRLFFADDHVLATVTPTPFLDLSLPGFRALERYLESARRVHALEIDWVLPGHGPALQGHRALLERVFADYAEKAERVASLVKDGFDTAFEVSQKLFAEPPATRWFLTLSETVGLLEVLETQGRVARSEGAVDRYACG